MFWTKRWGYVTSWQELQMLCRAERTLKQIRKKPTYSKRMPAINLSKNK